MTTLDKGVTEAGQIFDRMVRAGDIRRREQAQQVMPTIQLICCLLEEIAAQPGLEQLQAQLSARERKELLASYQELAVAAHELRSKCGDQQPFEIVSHAGDQILLAGTAGYAHSAVASLPEPLSPAIKADDLTNMIMQTLQALVASGPLLRQIPPEAGPSHDTVEKLSRGLTLMACAF